MTPPKIVMVPVADLRPYERNARTHSPDQVAAIAASIKEFGFTIPVLVQPDRTIIAGHGRVEAAKLIGLAKVPTIVAADWSDAQVRAYVIADNKLALQAGWDETILAGELEALRDDGFALDMTGFDDFEITDLLAKLVHGDGDPAGPAPTDDAPGRGNLADRFGIPPFTVLDARQGWWQDRKRAWIALGIRSEVGRGEGATWGASEQVTEAGLNHYRDKAKGKGKGKARGFTVDLMRGERAVGDKGPTKAPDPSEDAPAHGTSIFDPVLCELAYRWFCPPGGKVLDPFAGGSVRGIVASRLGRDYLGIDLRPEQTEANRDQARTICAGYTMPAWMTADSQDMIPALQTQSDFVFSCPPYGSLEVYSDDPADLSVMSDKDFDQAYARIIAASVANLRPDRFACFVVGDYRDAKGFYRNFVSTTIGAFLKAGARLYNEAILVTAVGSLPVRAGRQFAAGRKLGKTHQNILVFVKGDPKRATEACGEVEFGDIPDDPQPDEATP
jgi:ParB-like chromosome segregation protein Spo0J/DNA modification methylase